MKTRSILYVITLVAYSLSLAHSVIPHHHHKTADEAAAHKHAEDHQSGQKHHHHHDNHEKSNEKKSDATGHFFFFNHDINADVLVRHTENKLVAKVKTQKLAVHVNEQVIAFAVSEHLVFHPPQDDPDFVTTIVSSGPLRAPPAYLI
jgi:hypothetical protein